MAKTGQPLRFHQGKPWRWCDSTGKTLPQSVKGPAVEQNSVKVLDDQVKDDKKVLKQQSYAELSHLMVSALVYIHIIHPSYFMEGFWSLMLLSTEKKKKKKKQYDFQPPPVSSLTLKDAESISFLGWMVLRKAFGSFWRIASRKHQAIRPRSPYASNSIQ